MSAGHISAASVSAAREHSYFSLKYVHHTTAEANTHVLSTSMSSCLKQSFLTLPLPVYVHVIYSVYVD